MPGVTWWKLTNSIMVRRAGRKPTFARPAASVSLGSKPTFAARCTNDRCQLRVGFHTLPQTTRRIPFFMLGVGAFHEAIRNDLNIFPRGQAMGVDCGQRVERGAKAVGHIRHLEGVEDMHGLPEGFPRFPRGRSHFALGVNHQQVMRPPQGVRDELTSPFPRA